MPIKMYMQFPALLRRIFAPDLAGLSQNRPPRMLSGVAGSCPTWGARAFIDELQPLLLLTAFRR